MADVRTSTTTSRPETDAAQGERDERRGTIPDAPTRREEPPQQNRLLWKPTEGQDVTKSLFPLTHVSKKK